MFAPVSCSWLRSLALLLLALAWCACSGAAHRPDAADGALDQDADAGIDTGAMSDTDGDAAPDVGIDSGEAGDGESGQDGGGDSQVDEFQDGGADAADSGPDGSSDADAGDGGCQDAGDFDYTCDVSDPATCPGGFCMLGMCLAPVLDPDRWDNCGDGSCGLCETGGTCPADCAPFPPVTAGKEYDNATTITVWAHGFYNKSADEIKNTVYGDDEGCGGILGEFASYGVVRPCGNAPPGDTAPDQLAETEYYGAIPASWMSPQDIAEVEQYPYDGTAALQRYALILAKFIRHKLTVSGATHVNLACHSMGCLIIRHLIENNLEGLAAEGRFVRWFTSSGVIAGAQLARLYSNTEVQYWARIFGLQLEDFVIMHPDFVQDNTCAWDHKLREGNSPYLAGMILHHACASDPHIQQAMGITLLDLDNPADEPNDGIMFTTDEYFHSQRPEVAFHAPAGEILQPTTNLIYLDHMNCPGSDAAAVLATATLFHRRKVFITLDQIQLIQDHENHAPFDGEHGSPPAEVIAEVEVRYNPYVLDQFGKDILVHEDKLAYRTPQMVVQDEGTSLHPGTVLYAGPVFDDMDQLHLKFSLQEADWYPKMGVKEWMSPASEEILAFDEQVPLADSVIARSNADVAIQIRVRVIAQY